MFGKEVVHIYDFETAREVYRFVVEEVIPTFGEILESLSRECAKDNF